MTKKLLCRHCPWTWRTPSPGFVCVGESACAQTRPSVFATRTERWPAIKKGRAIDQQAVRCTVACMHLHAIMRVHDYSAQCVCSNMRDIIVTLLARNNQLAKGGTVRRREAVRHITVHQDRQQEGCSGRRARSCHRFSSCSSLPCAMCRRVVALCCRLVFVCAFALTGAALGIRGVRRRTDAVDASSERRRSRGKKDVKNLLDSGLLAHAFPNVSRVSECFTTRATTTETPYALACHGVSGGSASLNARNCACR